jgi:hypothetical protein
MEVSLLPPTNEGNCVANEGISNCPTRSIYDLPTKRTLVCSYYHASISHGLGMLKRKMLPKYSIESTYG